MEKKRNFTGMLFFRCYMTLPRFLLGNESIDAALKTQELHFMSSPGASEEAESECPSHREDESYAEPSLYEDPLSSHSNMPLS